MLEEYGDLITVEELCEVLLIGRNTAYRLLNSGELNAFRIGRRWKVPNEEVRKFLQTGKSVLRK